MRDPTTWQDVRREATALVPDPQTTAETYPAIRLVLKRLQDVNALLAEPGPPTRSPKNPGLHAIYPEGVVAEVQPAGPAAHAGVRVGDVIQSVNGQPPRQTRGTGHLDLGEGPTFRLVLRRASLGEPVTATFDATSFDHQGKPTGRRVTTRQGGIGYIELPWDPGTPAYPTLAQQVVRGIDQAPTCGWVIDLRRNVGGDLWSFVAAIGPILGEGEIGAFVYASGEREPWAYRGGRVLWKGRERYESFVDGSIYRPKQAAPPVALLTSRLTTAAGELLVVAFAGRPQTRSFGEPTSGAPYLFYHTFLSDGAHLGVSGAYSADRSGRVYTGPIAPDESAATDWTAFGANHDPAVRAALDWLQGEPECSG